MADSSQAQMEQLRAAVHQLEAQRNVLGDAVVNTALSALKKQLAELEEQAAKQVVPAEDRRMVTILFTDMVGSTSMAEKLDPEEWRRIVAKTHTAIGDAITAHHGTIAQYLGDGLLAFFGAKEAGENDPENAIRAALNAQSAVTTLLAEDKVQVRVGIHTGMVVVGELGAEAHKEFTASGDAMNLAARLQSAAPPGGILISMDTYRYVRGVFDVTVRPPLTVKGKSEPIQTYLVRRAKPRPFRTVARGVAGIEIRTIGREAEMQALESAYLRAFEGHGVVWAQLLGEPGMGKSRLLEDMDEWLELREETFRLLRARAFPDDAHQPYALVRRLWFDRFQIAEDAPLEQAEARWVERFKELSGLDEYEEPAHALGLLVGLPFENSSHIKAMRSEPAQVKGRALVVSRELIKAVRQENPVVVLLEDLQWADPASWEYLVEVFLGATQQEPNGLFILCAARPDWQPPEQLSELLKTSAPDATGSANWGVTIPLSPLNDQASRELAREIFKRVPDVPGQVIDLLVERSEGVPYYTEELVNWFIDHGILDTHAEQWHFFLEKLKEQPLPATLHHLLLTRLSGLSASERSALQRGAIFGRRFWTGGLAALGVPGGAETLGHLQPRGFVEAQPESSFQGETEWSFHQNLLQEVTYESVLKRERTALHKVAAEWLEKQAAQAGRLDEFAGLLGEHCEKAGELGVAADWYQRAGQRAFGQGAVRQAMGFYTRALDLLPPVDRERRWQALLGKLDCHRVLGVVEPWKPDLAAFLDLARAFGDDEHLALAYLRQASFGISTDDPVVTDQAVTEALAAVRRCGNEAREAEALSIIAMRSAYQADKPSAMQNIEAAMRIAHRLGDETVISNILYRAAYCYATLGDLGKAFPLLTESVELAHRLGNRVREAYDLGNLANSYMTIGYYKQARALFEQSMAIVEALGDRRLHGLNQGNMGEIYLQSGDLRKARRLLEDALEELRRFQDHWGMVFVLHQLGLVLLAIGDASGASRCFTESHQMALEKGLLPFACESAAGLAASAAAQGQLEQARTSVQEAWDYLKAHGWAVLENPATAYRNCAEVLEALGDEQAAQEALESGHQALMEKADSIDKPEWRQSFLENVPENRALMEMWERRKLDKI
jgi:class 3 adenylate cyclase/tetratricopeptide (TPR) repeat protein